MKKLSLSEAREEIRKNDLWVWRQENWKYETARRESRRWRYLHDNEDRDFCDQDYPGPGLEAGFWEIPNM